MCFNGTNTRFYRKTDNIANMLFLGIFSSSENQFTRTNKILLRYPKKKLSVQAPDTKKHKDTTGPDISQPPVRHPLSFLY